MPNRDILPADIFTALGLLSRLPVPYCDTTRGAAAAWAMPVVGLVLGSIAALVISISYWLGLSANIASILALATLIITTGAMHEDGLADSADGLWGGWNPTTRLTIMKDSHIGTYGTLALILSLLLRWSALSLIIGSGHYWAGLITTAMISRASMTAIMHALPHARSGGLSHSVGQVNRMTMGLACGIALVTAVILVGLATLPVILACGLVTLACACIAQRKIGGQTGDILGATQQLSEIAALLTLAAIL